MRQIYTNENRLLAINSKNVLENAGIEVEIRNGHTSGSAIPGHQVWLELWVDDKDYTNASELLQSFDTTQDKKWICSKCSEQNAESFEVCWSCQNENIE
ncbi:DUF2007 domain-containing protein [Paraglaciecola sp. L3A3]|uniref:putative signal transducing protein n=1 Tax=Paraglaciecola sp. L3A3 TaxID=2686358 RepID=UPI00131D2285|nr:DUF2007 domain-containing protein [Paraglaciecola sp. L3A3]